MTADKRDSTHTLKTLLIVVGVPLLVLIWGVWQSSRLHSAAWYKEETAAVQAQIDQFSSAQEADPGKTLMVEDAKGKQIPLNQALSMLREYKYALENPDFLEYTLPHILNLVEVPLAAFSVLAGIFGLLYVRQLGQHARRSREALLRSFAIGQRIQLWLLGFFAIGVFGTLACAIGFELSRYVETGIDGRISIKLIVVGAILVMGCLAGGWSTLVNLLAASRAAFSHEPITVMGRAISQSEAPRLWGYVANIAKRIDAQMPDSIVVGLNEGFFVTEVPVRLASGTTLPAGRVLYLPLPYLNFLDKREVAAIIGHELGHFAGQDTQYTQHFAPIYASAIKSLQAVSASGGDASIQACNPVFLLSAFFLRSFHEAVQHWSRVHELAADQVGARVIGAQSAALALLRTCALAPRVEQALYESWQSGGAGAGVMERIRELVRENGLEDPAKHLDFSQPHPTDSHPPLSQRLQALGFGQPDEALLVRARDTAISPMLVALGLEAAPVSTAPAADSPAGGQGSTTPNHATGAVPQGGLGQSLETEFQHAAQAQRDAHVAQLRTLAKLGQGTVDFFERRFIGIVVSGMVGTILSVSAGFIPEEAGVVIRSFFFLGGPLLLLWAVRNWRLRKQVVLTFEAEGFWLVGATEPLRWIDMADYSLHSNSDEITVIINLEQSCHPAPSVLGRRGKYKHKGHLVSFSLGSLKKCSRKQFAELIHQYWVGARAREELKRMTQPQG